MLVRWTRRLVRSERSPPDSDIHAACNVTGRFSCWGDDERGQRDAPDGAFEAVATEAGTTRVACGLTGRFPAGVTTAPTRALRPLRSSRRLPPAGTTLVDCVGDGTITCWGQ